MYVCIRVQHYTLSAWCVQRFFKYMVCYVWSLQYPFFRFLFADHCWWRILLCCCWSVFFFSLLHAPWSPACVQLFLCLFHDLLISFESPVGDMCVYVCVLNAFVCFSYPIFFEHISHFYSALYCAVVFPIFISLFCMSVLFFFCCCCL